MQDCQCNCNFVTSEIQSCLKTVIVFVIQFDATSGADIAHFTFKMWILFTNGSSLKKKKKNQMTDDWSVQLKFFLQEEC